MQKARCGLTVAIFSETVLKLRAAITFTTSVPVTYLERRYLILDYEHE